MGFYKQNFKPDADPALLVVQGTSRDFNSTLSEKFVAKALERDPAAAGAEYLAQFRLDLEPFVAREILEAAVDSGVLVRVAEAGHYV